MLPSRSIDSFSTIHTDMLITKVRLDSALRIYADDLTEADRDELRAIHSQLGDVEYRMGEFQLAKRRETEGHYLDAMEGRT